MKLGLNHVDSSTFNDIFLFQIKLAHFAYELSYYSLLTIITTGGIYSRPCQFYVAIAYFYSH